MEKTRPAHVDVTIEERNAAVTAGTCDPPSSSRGRDRHRAVVIGVDIGDWGGGGKGGDAVFESHRRRRS